MTLSRQTVLVILMLLFLIGGGFYYFVTLPVKQEILRLSEDAKREQSLVDNLAKAEQEQLSDGTVAFSPDFQWKIPEGPYLEQIMLDLTRVETISGVEMDGIGLSNSAETNVQQSGVAAGQGVQQAGQQQTLSFPPIGESAQTDIPRFPHLARVGITTKIKGTYTQVHRFFEEVRALPRIMRVEAVKVAGRSGNLLLFDASDAQTVQLSAEVTLAAYFDPDLQSVFPQRLPIIVPPPEKRQSPFQ